MTPAQNSLQAPVDSLLQLLQQEPTLRSQHDITTIQASLKKAIAPTFEIVFAGAFSAGKSMLINALLERELLYSAEGHATGTECQIAYAESEQERVVLTFLSEAEIREQANILCQRMGFVTPVNINQTEVIRALRDRCAAIVQEEGGASKSDLAKQASALNYLLEGFANNREHIHTVQNNTFSMERFDFTNLQEAASYARRGGNSAVLKRVEYYCHHDLLRDGNVLIDTPGIDAPVKQDADLTYEKIEHPDTSAVVCVMKSAATGELTSEETELLETVRSNLSIRDRVFFAFNRIDETWTNAQLRQKLDRLIRDQFQDSSRVYKMSGLLGFYGSQIKATGAGDRFGLDSIFAQQVNSRSEEETPQFINEFITYCSSGKLVGSQFRPTINGFETPNQNYVRILSQEGAALIDQLIKDSGIAEFRSAITRYLTEEKRPSLLANLADDLQPVCISLKKTYLEAWQYLEQQPRDREAIKEQELRQLNSDLKQIGDAFIDDTEQQINEAVASDKNVVYESGFIKLRARMVSRLDELLNTFSVAEVHKRAQASHKRHAVVPLIGILAEAFYYLADGLEEVLVDASKEVVSQFFAQLIDRVRQQDYYRNLYRLLGNDSGIEQNLIQLQQKVLHAVVNEAQLECDRYVRERPEFYTEGSCSMWQLRQTLQQTCRGYDYQTMIEAEPAIRQLLKLDFEQKVRETVVRTFRQTINQTLNTHLLDSADRQAELILQQYDQARSYLAQLLDKEAEATIRANQQKQLEVEQKIDIYNQAISAVNERLEWMKLDRKKLPLIHESDLAIAPDSFAKAAGILEATESVQALVEI